MPPAEGVDNAALPWEATVFLTTSSGPGTL